MHLVFYFCVLFSGTKLLLALGFRYGSDVLPDSTVIYFAHFQRTTILENLFLRILSNPSDWLGQIWSM